MLWQMLMTTGSLQMCGNHVFTGYGKLAIKCKALVDDMICKREHRGHGILRRKQMVTHLYDVQVGLPTECPLIFVWWSKGVPYSFQRMRKADYAVQMKVYMRTSYDRLHTMLRILLPYLRHRIHLRLHRSHHCHNHHRNRRPLHFPCRCFHNRSHYCCRSYC